MIQSPVSPYLVEIAPTRSVGTATLADRARATAGDTRFLRSIYVPEDDRWFLLYEGVSVASVARAAERAAVDVVSIAVARDVRVSGGHDPGTAADGPSATHPTPTLQRPRP